ncbi:hypothetical protein [Alicyclobacillus mengziensis]|uniref:Uncharacterized protein n=1 Tax=Alicyclobacillus mengziensis TaxID=2931921 RepID=A0A9X7W1K1_9BACL|nr:hypothetical protein [Alicyclobacillus mengziensis]QSO48522.1 hypothetical protein JZ786_05915 [Alicyclobacillus mengziensis]
MNVQRLRWWEIIGRSDSGTTFVHMIEATSRRKVIRHFGGVRQCKDFDGTIVPVTFSRHQGEIQVRSKKWSPGTLTHLFVPDAKTIVQVIRAPRYKCECGEIHISEDKYPSIWCTCGKRAYPVVDVSQQKQQDIQLQEPFSSMHERRKQKDIQA